MSEPLLNFDELTAEIPGGDLETMAKAFVPIRDALIASREGKDPNDPDAKPDPNWSKLIIDAKNALTDKCKHVYVGVMLAEGLLMQNGFAGVRDGMKLLRLLFERCWDRMLPPIEEPGDEERRIGNVNSLGNSNSKPYYPIKVRMTPLFQYNGEPLSWQSWKDGNADFVPASKAASYEQCQSVIDEIGAAAEEVAALERICEEKAPNSPPELGELRQSLDECMALVKGAMAGKEPTAAGGEAAAGGTASSPGGAAVSAAGMGREAIYNQIEKLADQLNKLEPHSPVPWLLRRVKDLKEMAFHELVNALTKSQSPAEFITPTPPEEGGSSE